MSTQMPALKSPCVCTTVRKANRALFRFYESALAESDLSVVQFAILRSLEKSGDLPLSRIADDQVMERTSLYRTIKPLIDAGAVKLRDADRGKAKIASLTRRGRRLIQQTQPYWEAAQQSVVSKIGARQWERLSSVLLDVPELLQS